MPSVAANRPAYGQCYSQAAQETIRKLGPDQRLALYDAVQELSLDPRRASRDLARTRGGFHYRKDGVPVEFTVSVDDAQKTICVDQVVARTSLCPLLVICYSHKDKEFRDELIETLQPLVRARFLEVWADKAIESGRNWRNDIRRCFGSARLAVLLVSRHFLASDFIASEELPRLLERESQGALKLHWIEVGDCVWTEVGALEERQALHDPKRPLNSLNKAEFESALKEIFLRIKKAVSEPAAPPARGPPAAAGAPPPPAGH